MKQRATTTAIFAMLIGATAAWAGTDCANYISGDLNGGPAAGYLLGEQLVTEEFAFGVDAGVHAGFSGTVQYSVGYYRMNNGRVLRIDCRTYSVT